MTETGAGVLDMIGSGCALVEREDRLRNRTESTRARNRRKSCVNMANLRNVTGPATQWAIHP